MLSSLQINLIEVELGMHCGHKIKHAQLNQLRTGATHGRHQSLNAFLHC